MPACTVQSPETCQRMNLWMWARLQAGFKSRAEATEWLPLGERTLARIENDEKIPSPEEAKLIAETYKMPNLVLQYCAEFCPIGSKYGTRIEGKDLAAAVLKLIKEYRDVKEIKNELINITADGVIDDNEKPVFKAVLKELDELGQAIIELKFWALSQYRKQKPASMVAEKRAPYETKRAATAAK